LQIGKKKNLNSDDDFDARADDTAYASTVAITLGAACSPDGYEIVRECPLPDVTTKEVLNQLIGQKILYAWDDDTAYGWYIGTICNTRLGVRDMRAVPRANCAVKYDKNDTKLAGLHGQVVQ
jgi:hypothetical protein